SQCRDSASPRALSRLVSMTRHTGHARKPGRSERTGHYRLSGRHSSRDSSRYMAWVDSTSGGDACSSSTPERVWSSRGVEIPVGRITQSLGAPYSSRSRADRNGQTRMCEFRRLEQANPPPPPPRAKCIVEPPRQPCAGVVEPSPHRRQVRGLVGVSPLRLRLDPLARRRVLVGLPCRQKGFRRPIFEIVPH